MEEDWRLFQREDIRRPQRQHSDAENFLSPGAAASSSSPSAADYRSLKAKVQLGVEWGARVGIGEDFMKQTFPPEFHPDKASFHTRAQKPKAKEFEEPSKYILDMVRICTQAHRANKGELVWLTWDGSEGPKQLESPSPEHASNFIAISRKGASWIADRWDMMQ